MRLPSHLAATLIFAAGWALMPARGLAQIKAPPTDSAAPAPALSFEPTLTHDSDGGVTVRAFRLDAPLRTDGQLDEPIYGSVPPAADFIQQEPLEGEAATEKTEGWIFFDDRNIYVSARAWDSHPERMVASEMRRDGRQINQGENISVIFDTFHDGRNAFYFQTNPLGVLRDQEVTEERPNPDWNTVWEVRTGRFDQGWTFEMVIPFRSLRYPGPGPQVWGFTMRRFVAWKNERSFLTPIPRSSGNRGIYRISLHATLVGLETPDRPIDLEVKPYAISAMTSDLDAADPISNRTTGDIGGDLRYGLTQTLTANLTLNTDFAQVEADEEQINLTRFSQSFPEKREFFLEGRGTYDFGRGSGGGRGGGRGAGGGGGGNPDVPVMFFSRRIGLSEGDAIPVRVGARLTGKAGPVTVGALNVQTGDAPDGGALRTNFSVVRVKHEIMSRSSIGLLATHRTRMISQDGSNTVLGLDAQFQFLTDWEINSYYARSSTPKGVGDDASYRAQVAYSGDRYGLQIGHLMVGDDFNPEVGFMRREDFRLNSAQVRFSPRLFASRSIRRLVWQASFNHITDASSDVLESRQAQVTFRTELESGDMWDVQYTSRFEFLDSDFEIAQDVVIPVGEYHFGAVRTTYTLAQQHRLSGRLNAEYGSFFDGDRTAIGYSGRIEISPRFSLEPSLSQNWLDLVGGAFNTQLVTVRAIVTPSARSALSSLIQYNSRNSAWSSNVRFRWEYSPGSELFVVYSDSRDTSLQGFPELKDRTLAVKITRLLRF